MKKKHIIFGDLYCDLKCLELHKHPYYKNGFMNYFVVSNPSALKDILNNLSKQNTIKNIKGIVIRIPSHVYPYDKIVKYKEKWIESLKEFSIPVYFIYHGFGDPAVRILDKRGRILYKVYKPPFLSNMNIIKKRRVIKSTMKKSYYTIIDHIIKNHF